MTTMQSSGETLQALISDILDFSRVEAEKLSLANEPFNPEGVIANVLEIVGIHAGRLKLNVGYHVDEGVPKTVLGDAMRAATSFVEFHQQCHQVYREGGYHGPLIHRYGTENEKNATRELIFGNERRLGHASKQFGAHVPALFVERWRAAAAGDSGFRRRRRKRTVSVSQPTLD